MSKFITFEGCEGSGKSTQSKKLYNYLIENGKKAVLTREPGGTELAELIRSELLLKNHGIDDPLTEFLLITAARRDHIKNFIQPKIAQGYIVICDRFFDSSLAYQGYFKGLSIDKMQQIHKIATDDYLPDITFFLDIPHTMIKKRLEKRKASNHYDQQNEDFHIKIIDAFREMANNNERIFKIDGSKKEQDITKEIIKILSF